MLKKFQKKLKYWLPRFFFQRKNLGSYYRLVCPSVCLSVRLSVRRRRQMGMKMKSDRTDTWYISSTSRGAFNLTWSDRSDYV